MGKTDLQEDTKGESFSLMVEHVKDYAIFLTDPTGTILTWNQAAAEMKGYTAAEIVGSDLRVLYTDEEVAAGSPEHNLRLAAEKGTYQEEAWRKRKDGTVYWALIELIALRHANGELFGFCKITRDLTERRKLQRGLASEKARANATLGAIHECVISTQIDGLVDYMNPRAEEITGWTSSEARGRTLDEVVRKVLVGDLHPEDAALLNGCSIPGAEQIVARDGTRHIVETTTSIIIGGTGQPEGRVIVLRDVAPQLRSVAAVRHAENRKDEFLAMLAHELRNPLAPVSAAAELLNSGRLDQHGVRKSSQVIIRQIAHMTSLVDDLLDVSRITRGLVSLQTIPLNFKTLVAGALEQARPMVEAKRHALHVSLPADAANISGDPVRLIQVLVNLINNAAKYTPARGEISIKVSTTDLEIFCSVADNGIGIDSAMQPHVFELFEQAQRSSDRAQGGLGIGLALVKRITELHGGSVSCVSNPGKGSVFTVRLPRLHQVDGVPERRNTKRGIEPAKDALRILIVDDNVDGAEMLGALLELEGHEVTTANDSKLALAISEERDFEVCILDIGLPELNGYELCKRILDRSPERSKPTIIALTGFGHDRDRDAAYEAGFSHYLVKPVDVALLNAALDGINPIPFERQQPDNRYLH